MRFFGWFCRLRRVQVGSSIFSLTVNSTEHFSAPSGGCPMPSRARLERVLRSRSVSANRITPKRRATTHDGAQRRGLAGAVSAGETRLSGRPDCALARPRRCARSWGIWCRGRGDPVADKDLAVKTTLERSRSASAIRRKTAKVRRIYGGGKYRTAHLDSTTEKRSTAHRARVPGFP